MAKKLKDTNSIVKRTISFLQVRKPAEIIAASALLSLFMISWLSHSNYLTVTSYLNAYQPQTNTSTCTKPLNQEQQQPLNSSQQNGSMLNRFCEEHQDACQSQDNPELITWIQQVWLQHLHRPDQPLNFEKKPVFRGQIGVPLFIDRLLDYKKNGFFIECGAWNGEHLSNTILFEIKRQWKGLLIEPNVEGFAALKTKNRNAVLVNSCLSTKTKPMEVEFINAGTGGGLQNKVVQEWAKVGETWENVNVFKTNATCLPIFSILQSLGNPEVDYFSLDVEGSDWAILQTIPWDKVNINVWSIEVIVMEETGHTRSDLRKFMQDKGYVFVTEIKEQDMIFAKRHLLERKEKFRGKWLI